MEVNSNKNFSDSVTCHEITNAEVHMRHTPKNDFLCSTNVVKENGYQPCSSAFTQPVPSSPIEIKNPDSSTVCSNKVNLSQSPSDDEKDLIDSYHIYIPSSLQSENEFNETFLSKSCDYNNDEHVGDFGDIRPTISRSFSEDVLLRPSSTYIRRVSVVSTKGKLLGCPRVLPREKFAQSGSFVRSDPTKPPDISDVTVLRKRKFTRQQKLIAFCLCLVDFTSFLSMSIIAPFFPREAASKGMREAVSGFVFSIYALIVMLTSPIFGKLLPTVGARFMFQSGVFFCGVCNILFGLLDKVNGEVEFTVLCFVVRSFEALGAAAFCTASCTILIDQFPDDIGTVFGFTETCIGIGMSIGPAIGGALYSVGGFGLPFFTLGVFVVLTSPICWFLMRNMSDPEIVISSDVSYRKLLSMPHVIVVMVILVVGSQAQGFIDPTLEPHMRQYNLNAGIIGLLFLLLSGAYAISSPIVGWVSGKMENKYPLMIAGLVFVTIALLLLGPSEILPIQGSVWLSTVALALMGFSFAAAYVPTFESIFIAAINGGLDDDINTYSIVSGLWNSMYSLGEVTGPSLGGILSDFFTFPEASTLMAFCSAAACVIAVLAWINPFSCFGTVSLDSGEEKRKEASPTPSENTPLQTDHVSSYGSLPEIQPSPTV